MNTHGHRTRDVATQKVAEFTGEGAYHGSTRARRSPAVAPPPPPPPEMSPRSLDRHLAEGRAAVADFDARFENLYAVRARLAVPAPEAIRDDGVTFCWCPFEVAAREAGPLTRAVLAAAAPHLVGDRRFVYVDSKIQHFEPGDLPVDSRLWHVDGSIVARGERVARLGHALVHDMAARLDPATPSPRYLAYQSSSHCATEFLDAPLTVRLPELVPDFDLLDARVREAAPTAVAQPAGTIVAFDGASLHRAVPATAAGWRLWLRVVETDREVVLDHAILDCYDTVFRPR
jgi:hypothetical protein